MSKMLRKILIIFAVLLLVAFFHFDGVSFFSLEYVKLQQANFAEFYKSNVWLAVGGFFTIYVLATALSFPGAAVLTLLAGALFGPAWGTIIVSFASTIGASLAFLLARFLFGDYLQARYSDKLASVNKGIEREGAFYLFTLRLVPVFPFFLVNIVMGLTKMKLGRYFWVSQIGMLPGTFAYVYAGTEIAAIDSLSGIVSPGLVAAFTLIGLLPLLAKKIVDRMRAYMILRHYSRPKKYDYNLIVIGAGAAGLVSSYIAAAVKAKVLLVEKNKMGGDCLNTGCVPSKALIKSAAIINDIKNAEKYGIKEAPVKFDFQDIMQRVHSAIEQIEPHDSVDRYSKMGVDCRQDHAQILDPYRVRVGANDVYTAKNIIVATGAAPFVPDILGLSDIDYLTSDNVWQLKQLPEKLLVLGGGVIGCELAQCFARLGSEVIIVEKDERVLAREDREAADHVKASLIDDGVEILCGHEAIEFGHENKSKYLLCKVKNEQVKIEFSDVLIAIGRKANISGFGLQELGVEIADNGKVSHDNYLRTNYPNIFVCGDVAGPYHLTHASAHQAWYASVNALFGFVKKFKANYSVMPSVVFTDPEVAAVGMSEDQLKQQNTDYEVTKYDISDLDRTIVDGAGGGFVKVMTRQGSDKILGVVIVGKGAADMLSEFTLAMRHNIGLNKILSTIHPYPTMSEANKYAAGMWKQNNAPKKLLKILEFVHRYRRGGE